MNRYVRQLATFAYNSSSTLEIRDAKDSEDNTRAISGRGEVAGGKLVVIAVAFREEGAGGRLSLAIFQLTP